MTLSIINSGPLVSEDDIKMIETMIGSSLPAEYRLFLCRHNGGHPEPSCFKKSTIDDSPFNGSCIHYFYGIGDEAPHAQLLTSFNTFKGRIPVELVPIADDPFGNQICIAIQGNEKGSIYFWDHESEHYPPTFQNVFKLALSFDMFVNGLFERERDWETALDKAVRENDVKSLQRFFECGVDLEQEDQWGRTLIENAAIANSVDVIGYLFALGVNLRNALALAEENAKYFPEHQRAVSLLRELGSPTR